MSKSKPSSLYTSNSVSLPEAESSGCFCTSKSEEKPANAIQELPDCKDEAADSQKSDPEKGSQLRMEVAPSKDITSAGNTALTKVDNEEKSPKTGVVDDKVTGRPPETRYLDSKELAWISFSFSMASFMIALDYSILATAIPKITSQFNSLEDVGWYGSAYMLTEISLQPSWGRAYSFFDRKWLYMITLLIFEVGSIICAAAPNSISLIIGRAVTGAGGAGMLCGSLAIFGQSVPLKQRPFGTVLVTSVFTLASLVGPTVGGLFVDTRQLTWRFCFWINLPVGAACAAITWKVLRPQPAPCGDLPLREKIAKCDLPGAVLLTAGLVCLFIALTWGGNKYLWSDPEVWGCLIAFGLLEIIFFTLQYRLKENATIPMRILTQRTVALSCLYNAMYSIASIVHGYYLSFYFQSVRGFTAAGAGVRGLPYCLAGAIFTFVSGWSMSNQGYYVQFMWVGAALYTVGSGLMYTYSLNSSIGQWLGYQVVAGSGLGLSCIVPFIAVQVVLPDDDMPIACAWVTFFRILGGAIGISIAQNIFSQSLIGQLKQIPGVNIGAIVSTGASNANLVEFVPEDLLLPVRVAYNTGVRNAFVLSIAACGVAFVSSLFMERLRILDDDPETPASTSTSEEEISVSDKKKCNQPDAEKIKIREIDNTVT